MKLPEAGSALVDVPKVRDYLLSDTHPVGRFKAVFFRSLGYSLSHWQELAADLRRHAVENDAARTDSTAYGQKYEVYGTLSGAGGEARCRCNCVDRPAW